MTGTLYGIGVGPGDPELLTLKAVRLLRACPVIAYPETGADTGLARRIAAPHIPPGRIELALPMPIRPDPAAARAAHDRAAERLATQLAAGRDVAALCLGDPLLYASFQYLLARLHGRFPTRVVPGVTSLSAAAAAAGQALAGRDEVLAVVPATLPEAVLAARLAAADSAAILKPGRHLAKLRRVLAGLGRLETARHVARASQQAERIRPLAELADDETEYFAIILVPPRGTAGKESP